MFLPDVLGGFRIQRSSEEGCATSLQNHIRDTKELVATSYIAARQWRIYRSPAKYATSSNRRYAHGRKKVLAVFFVCVCGPKVQERGASEILPHNAAYINGPLVGILRTRLRGCPDSTHRAH